MYLLWLSMTWRWRYLAQSNFLSTTSLAWSLALYLLSSFSQKPLQWTEINTHTHTHTHTQRYLLNLWRSQNNPRPSKTKRNQPKRPITGQNSPHKLRNNAKSQIWENLKFFTSSCLSNFEPKWPNRGILGQKVLTF